MRVLITGSTGLVGSRVVELLPDITFIPLRQSDVDITDEKKTHEFIASQQYDLLLHLAAYTNVDGAEKEPEVAYKSNVLGTKNLFTANNGKPFIYISTGFVFSGKNPPYDEMSVPDPVSEYGRTKYEGEKIIGDKGCIVRLEYPYRSPWDGKKDFVARIRELMENKTPITAVADATITPTFIDDIAHGLKHLMLHYQPGIVHFVGTESLSPYDAFTAIANTFHLDASLITKTSYAGYFAGKAARPQYATVRSLNNTFQPMKSFHEGLAFLSK